MSTSPDVLIVSGGLAGLCCARLLQEKGVSFRILESSDGVGGRVCMFVGTTGTTHQSGAR